VSYGSFPPPDPVAITRDWERWSLIPRAEALRACAFRWVAVVYRAHGLTTAAWLFPDSRFYRADHPIFYEELRYYAYAESPLGKLKAVRVDRPSGETQLLEAFDEAGESLNLGSPVPGAAEKPKKKLPIEFLLTDPQGRPMPGVAYAAVLPDGKGYRGKSDAEGYIRFPDNIHPGEAKLKLFPDAAHTPADASRGAGSPGPGLDATGAADLIAQRPGLPAVPRPIEILLVDEHGAPLGNRAFTARFPDGKVETGRSSRSGLIRFPDNTQSGDLLLTDLETGAAA
jgi:hypothetical protein